MILFPAADFPEGEILSAGLYAFEIASGVAPGSACAEPLRSCPVTVTDGILHGGR